MRQRTLTTFLLAVIISSGSAPHGQTNRRTSPRETIAGDRICNLRGSYRIDAEKSDKLYSAVRGATGNVPFQDQQQFFMDLSVRLTPPDLLAIDCNGNRVSVGSSRAAKITFLADGRLRRERLADGSIVNSRITMNRDAITFASTGKAEDNLNVVFRSIDSGRQLEVTRRIDAAQLTEPIVIRSVYEKISDAVDWDIYNGRLVAGRNSDGDRDRPTGSLTGRGDSAELRESLEDWIAATNRKNIERQMRFYMPRLKAFYLTRNTSIEAVRAEKDRAFRTASSIDIHADEPEIVLQDGGRTAVMRFRKSYRIADRTRTRSGVVIQELRWQRTPEGWRIFSERDVRVIR